jgi:hypothetical protein
MTKIRMDDRIRLLKVNFFQETFDHLIGSLKKYNHTLKDINKEIKYIKKRKFKCFTELRWNNMKALEIKNENRTIEEDVETAEF